MISDISIIILYFKNSKYMNLNKYEITINEQMKYSIVKYNINNLQ